MSHIFPGQDDSEIIKKVIYKHIFSILPFVIVSIALFITGLFLVYSAASGTMPFSDDTFSSLIPDQTLPGTDSGASKSAISIAVPWLAIGLSISAFAGFMLLATLYIWRQNRMIMTSENVVDIDQRGLFHKDIATLRLSRVQDIAVVVSGPFQTFFKYGTITIQTAGEKENFSFDYIPHPYEMKKYLVDLFEEFVEHRATHSEDDGVVHHTHESLQPPVVTDQTGDSFTIPSSK